MAEKHNNDVIFSTTRGIFRLGLLGGMCVAASAVAVAYDRHLLILPCLACYAAAVTVAATRAGSLAKELSNET